MGINLEDILLIGFADGLIWFPFVLGIGLLFTYLKEIDVSIDGVVILSGIGAAFMWQATESYVLSLLSGIVLGMAGSFTVALLQTLFLIPGLMAGIIFSLIAHSISVLVIGESLVLHGTKLISGFGTVQGWQVWLVIILSSISILFYNSRFGIAVRKMGNGSTVNTVYDARKLRWSAYLLSGFLYGLGGALYIHSQGLAKSGGSFEFLIVSLSAFLCTVRIGGLVKVGIMKLIGFSTRTKREYSPLIEIVHQITFSPAVKALIGAILFETLVFLIIAVSPNPMAWKLLFAIALLLALSSYSFPAVINEITTDVHQLPGELEVSNVNVHYDIGAERREVFRAASATFGMGINLIRGSNGTGKSTLLKAIAGTITPETGQILFGNRNLLEIDEHKRPCYFLHQNPTQTLASELTAVENLFVAFGGAKPLELCVYKQAILCVLKERLDEIGAPLIYNESSRFWHKPVMMMSGGEAHCVALYCALLSEKPILLADEPTTGLDQKNFDRLITIMDALSASRTILLTSHDSRVAKLNGRTYIIEGGTIKSSFK